MRLLRLFGLLAFLLAAHAAFAGGRVPAAERSFAELARNTKEADSLVLRDADTTEYDELYPAGESARARFESASREAFRVAAPRFDAAAGAVCEPALLAELAGELARQGVPADGRHVRFALRAIRAADQIDDVILLPLLAAVDAWAKVGYDAARGETPVGRAACPTETYLEVAKKVRAAQARRFKRKHLAQEIERLAGETRPSGEKRYAADQIAWFRALQESRYDAEAPFALPAALAAMARTKDSSPRAKTDDPPTRVMSKRRKKSGGLSNRVLLYQTYTAFQIQKLVERYEEFVDSMDVVTAEMNLVIAFKNGRETKTIAFDAEEQRRAAALILNKEIAALRNSKLMEGKQPTFDDVIIAAVETGYIHADELDRALAVDDLWNPERSGWDRAWDLARRYGTTALVLIPNPISFWFSIGISLVESALDKKNKHPTSQGISIF